MDRLKLVLQRVSMQPHQHLHSNMDILKPYADYTGGVVTAKFTFQCGYIKTSFSISNFISLCNLHSSMDKLKR